MDEAHTHLLSGRCGNLSGDVTEFEKHFTNFDKDRDRKLSFAEINTGG